ncbi:MAG: glycosyltransferase family 39 protein [Gaiellaceae bacterium]
MRGVPQRLRRSPAAAALTALILLAGLLRALAGLRVSGPFIAPDEMTYAALGRSLWSSGHLEVLGQHVDLYSVLYPAFAGLPLTLGGLKSGFTALTIVQPFVMALAALPVYLWTRRLVSAGPALLAAALTLALPDLAYSSLIMSEVVFYPLMALAAWRLSVAIAEPSWRHDALALAAIVLALLTRIQALVLVPALVLALLIVALLERSGAVFRSSLRLLGGIGALAAAWILWRLGSGGTLLGVYASAAGGYHLSAAARYVGYHLADLVLLVGILPALALALLLVSARKQAERELAALLGVGLGLSLSLLLEVGVFASKNVQHLAERDLIGAAPPLFVALGVWIGRGWRRPRPFTYLCAFGAAAALLLLPIRSLTDAGTLHDGLSLVPIVELGHLLGGINRAYSLLVAPIVLAFALLPRRALPLVIVTVAVLMVAGSVQAERYVAQRAAEERQGFPGAEIGWVDAATREPVAYLYGGEPWDAVWQQIYWNPRIERVLDLGPARVPGPVLQERVRLRRDGVFVDQVGAPIEVSAVVAQSALALLGEPLATVPQAWIVQTGLTLWRTKGTLRLSTTKSGVAVNGDIATRAHFTVYDCRGGLFILTLLGKQDAHVQILLNGNAIRNFDLRSGVIWRGRMPTSGSRDGICRYVIAVSGYTDSTAFLFERSS